MLEAFGFQEKWIDLVMRTVKNNHFSILVNGELCGFLNSEHGLRQGVPLSPALFVLAVEY